MNTIRKGRVSFVIPAYNSAATIVAAVESCLAQTYRDIEIIVMDDGSSDDLASRLAPLRERIVLRRKANGGVASARNRAVLEASGEFIAWLDDDDICDPARIESGVRVLDCFPDVVMVSSDFSAFRDGEPDYEASHIATYYRAVRLAGGAARLYDERHEMQLAGLPRGVHVGHAYERLVRGNFVHPPTVLLRRSAWDAAGPFDERLRYGSEYDHTLRLARLGRFAYIDAALLRYRRGESQLSHRGGNGGIPLDTVTILDKLRRDDPRLAQREAPLLRRRYAGAFLDAAEMSLPGRRARSAWLLARSLRYGPPAADVLRVTAKAALPRPVISLLKKTFARAVPAAASR